MSNMVMKPCKVCATQTMHTQPSTSHVVHLILSLLTWGVWLIVWFIVANDNNSNAQCTQCGAKRGILGSTSGGVAKVSPDTHVKCPDCRELILKEARKCKHCGTMLTPQA
jgi:hypothetical protein